MSSTMRFLSYLVTLLVAVFITACGGGGGSAGTITPGSSDALRTDVPAGLTFVVSEAKSFTIAGGKAPYSVISNREGIAVAGVTGSTLTIGGVFPGTAELTVRDALGQTVTAGVTITENGLALATTAPSSLTMAMGQQLSYPVGGGIAPYAVTSANPNIVAASISGHTLNLTGITPGGPIAVTIRDSLNATVAVNVTVTPVGGLALFTTAPSPLTLPIAATQVFSVGGGVGPYVATSSNTSIAQVTIAANTLTIQGIAGGAATITVRDAQNTVKTIDVTVPPLAAVFTTAPAGLTIGIGSAPTFTIGGGTGTGYKATSSNEAVAFPTVTGATLQISALKSGSASIVVRDSSGNSTTVSVTVPAPVALFTTAPSSITIAVATAPTFTVAGGVLPYSLATTSNAAVAIASLSGTNSTTLKISGLSAGTAIIQVHDAIGTPVSINVTVVASVSSTTPLFTSAPGTVTLVISPTPVVYSVGGGTEPYTATSSNPSVLTVVSPIVGGNLNVTAISAGTAQVVIHDALGATVSFNVTVSGTSVLPLFTTAPSSIVMNVGTPRTFTVGGGTSPYFLTSNNTGVVTATPSTSTGTMTLTPIAAGSANIQVVDSKGSVVTVAVTVTSSSTVPLFSTAPSSLTVETGKDQTYNVGGGSGQYSMTNSNPSVATAAFSPAILTGPTGGPLTIHGVLAGDTTITIFDGVGASVVLNVTVAAPATDLQLLPATLTISDKQNTPIAFTISGGTGTFNPFTTNTTLAPVTVVGSQLIVGGVNRCVAADTEITLTVIDSLGAVATSKLKIVDQGGSCP